MKNFDKKDLRTINLQRQLSGDPENFNEALEVKDQLKVIPYNTKREIERSAFTVQEILGSGNFGNVFKGELTGLYRQNEKTTIAIKSKRLFRSVRSVRKIL